jgi:hypothetical protein
MYIALLGVFAFALPLLRTPVLLLALSGLAYFAVRLTGYNLPSWTGEGWYFNPIAWQFLFMIGAVLSYSGIRPPGPRWAYDALAAGFLLFGVLLLWLVWPYPDVETHMPAAAARILLSVDKEGLHPMRLLSILALAWLVARMVPDSAQWLRARLAKPFILCGQHSLGVFCAGIFLSFLARLAMEERPDWAVQATVNAVGSVALVGVGALSAWYRQKGAMARAALPAPKHAGNASVV